MHASSLTKDALERVGDVFWRLRQAVLCGRGGIFGGLLWLIWDSRLHSGCCILCSLLRLAAACSNNPLITLSVVTMLQDMFMVMSELLV